MIPVRYHVSSVAQQCANLFHAQYFSTYVESVSPLPRFSRYVNMHIIMNDNVY